MTIRIDKRVGLLFLCSALTLAAAPTLVVAAEPTITLEEVVVTARKREESLQEVPVAISVFTGAALQEAGISSARDLYAATPGLNYDTGFDQNAATPAIRGVGSSEIATYRQKVTTFIDGMPILGQQGAVPFTALQQVEVLRGPQSAAFGRSTFGGAINFITRDPTNTPEGSVNAEVGSNGMTNADGLVAGPIADRLFGLVAAGVNRRDGESSWKTRLEGAPLGGESSENVFAKLLFKPTDTSHIKATYSWLNVDNQQTPRIFMPLNDPNRRLHPDAANQSQLCGGGPPQVSCAYVGTVRAVKNPVYDYNYAAAGIADPFVRDKRNRFELDGGFDFANGLSLQAMGFQSWEYYERQTDSNLTNDAFGFERDPTNIDEKYAEVRLTSPGRERFRYGVGASWYDYSFLTNIYRSRANYDAGIVDIRFAEAATNTGYFFNLTYDITDRVTASLEGRYQNDDVSGSSPRANAADFKATQTTTAFLPRASLTFSPTPDTTIYAQVAKGNNPAGVNAGALNADVLRTAAAFPTLLDPSPVTFYKEEKVLSYEVGIKGKFRNRATYAVNIYKLDWQNYTQPFNLNSPPAGFVDLNNDQLGDVGTAYAGYRFNIGRSFLGAGDVSGQGIEFEGNYYVTDAFKVGLAASYTDITYSSNACSTLPLDFGVVANAKTNTGLNCVSVAGHELGTQPKVSGSLTLEYKSTLASGVEWFARWNTRFNSSQYSDEMNLATLPGFSISDIRLGLNRGKWRAEVYGTNIFDEDAPQGLLDFFDGRVLFPAGPPAGTPAPPPFAHNLNYTTRRGPAIGARFSYSFGGR